MNTFRITDGTTTISLMSGSPIKGCTYAPDAPSPAVARYASGLADGDVINSIVRHNVSEPVSVIVEGSSAAMETLRIGIQRLLWLAEQRQQTGTGKIVYVEYQETADSDTFRSELIGGVVEYASALARRSRDDVESQAEILINWERMWFWEDTVETAVATAERGSSTYTTDAKTVYNHQDPLTAAGNFVDIQADGVEGELPTPARIWLRNMEIDDLGVVEYLFFNSWRANLGGAALFLQWEDSTGASSIADAGCSGGEKMRNTVNASGSLSSFDVATINNGADRLYFRPIVRYTAIPANQIWVKFMLISYQHGYAELGVETEEKLLGDVDELQVFDALPLRTVGSPALAMAMRSKAGSLTVDSDYLYLSPCDSIRTLRGVGLKLVSDGKVNDLGNGQVELLDNMDVEYGFVTPIGPPLMLFPGVAQRVSFLLSGAGSSPFWELQLKLYYRKRVLVP